MGAHENNVCGLNKQRSKIDQPPLSGPVLKLI